jgi:hypothetical protein
MTADDGDERGTPDRGPTLERLEAQITWYDRHAKSSQTWFKTLKVSQIILGGLVPVVAAAGGARWVLGALGAAVVIIEGVQQLFQFHKNWISYRATCEALRREQHFFDVGAGPYQLARDPGRLLAERLEQLVGRETSEWAAAEMTQLSGAGSSQKPGATT